MSNIIPAIVGNASVISAGVRAADGRGISSIERTSGDGSAGTQDTYTITFTDGSTTTFTIQNGANGLDLSLEQLAELYAAEEQRTSAESARVSAEASRVESETSRANAETGRTSAETNRASSETLRVNAETGRATAEDARETAETERASAEAARVSAETVRQATMEAVTTAYAVSARRSLYTDILGLASVVRENTVARNSMLFPVGDQIVIPWKDMDDASHNTDATAYQVPLNIIGHGEVELQNGDVVPGMYLQWHKCSSYGVQFSNFQAFMNCPDGLSAGTYHISFGQNWGQAIAQAYSFTLTQNVPAGGKLSGFQLAADTSPSRYTVKSWVSADAANPIETVSVSVGASGTDLGTLPLAQPANGMNAMQRVMYGSNRWSTSAVRQYLNKTGANWFESVEDFDIRPEQYNKKGFLTGFSDDFLAATRPIKIGTALNTLGGYTDDSETTYDRMFLPSLEQMNIAPQLATVEGSYFEYWRTRLGLDGFASFHPSVYDGYKIPSVSSIASQSIRLRSVNRSSTHNTWYIYSTGYIYNCNSYLAHFLTPICVIC